MLEAVVVLPVAVALKTSYEPKQTAGGYQLRKAFLSRL
jgi:hypothetical protein